MFWKKKDKEDPFIDSGQDWKEFLKANDLENAVALFEAVGVGKLHDLFLLQESDLKTEVKLNVVLLRRFQAATDNYKKNMKSLRRGSTATPLKPQKTPSPAFSAQSSNASLPVAPPTFNTNLEQPTSHGNGLSLGGADNNDATTTDDNAEGKPGEDVYEELDAPPPQIPSRPPPMVTDNSDDIYEPPPSDDPVPDTQKPAEVPDYEECDPDAMVSGRAAPRVRDRDLSVEPAPAALSDNPLDWSPPEVLRWLKENRLDTFKDVFYANAFNGKQLLALTPASFSSAGFSSSVVDTLMVAVQTLRSSRRAGVAAAVPARLPPPPPVETPQKMARVLYDYEAKKDGQLTIAEGEEVVVIDDTRGWWSVTNSQGHTGTVPSNYLEVIASSSAADMTADIINLDAYDWFSGDMERTVSEDRLRLQPVGTFLVRRNPSDFSDLTLSIKGSSGLVHLKLKAVDGKYALGTGSGDSTTIPELIDYHKRNDIRVTGREAVLLRRSCPR